jgi:hypothetical protein
MIVAAVHKALRWLCICAFGVFIAFDTLIFLIFRCYFMFPCYLFYWIRFHSLGPPRARLNLRVTRRLSLAVPAGNRFLLGMSRLGKLRANLFLLIACARSSGAYI